MASFAIESDAQLPMTQVDGSHIECPDANLHPCLTSLEQKLIQQHSDIVRRDRDGHLSARIKTGRWLPIEDGYALDIVKGERYVALMVFGEEDLSWRVLDLHTGSLTNVEGYPLFSPDGRHMVSAEFDDMNAHFLDIYDVTNTALVRVFRAIGPEDRWWPTHVCWIDNQTVGYARTTYHSGSDPAGSNEQQETLALRDGQWRIERSNARCALTP